MQGRTRMAACTFRRFEAAPGIRCRSGWRSARAQGSAGANLELASLRRRAQPRAAPAAVARITVGASRVIRCRSASKQREAGDQEATVDVAVVYSHLGDSGQQLPNNVIEFNWGLVCR